MLLKTQDLNLSYEGNSSFGNRKANKQYLGASQSSGNLHIVTVTSKRKWETNS